MKQSESVKEIAAALNKAQAEMSGAKKTSTNPFFKSSYADLAAVVEAVKTPFFENGLSYSQFPIFKDGFVGVETILLHVSGEWISGELVLPMTKQEPQAAGSAITYARRYALQSIAGIPAEDDDGNAASKSTPKKQVNEVLSDIDKQWITAIQAGTAKLADIVDPNSRKKIEGALK
tara:strand:+ start:42 stop:569 length:528 start_codon:yes stop_codon:yes gene_type:complete